MTRLRRALPYAVMLAVAAGLYWAAGRIEPGAGGRIGPGAWPKAILVFLALLCAWGIVKRLAGRDAEAASLAPAAERRDEGPIHPMLWWGIGLVAAYVVLVPWIGFFTATLLFLWGFPLAGGFRRPGVAAAVAAAGTLVLALVFMRVAYISLPLGEGPFRAVSLAVMKLLGAG